MRCRVTVGRVLRRGSREVALFVALVTSVVLVSSVGFASASSRTCERLVGHTEWSITPHHTRCAGAVRLLKRFERLVSEPRGWLCQGDGSSVPIVCVSRRGTEFKAVRVS